jgi:RNA polymerase sigma factor (sigma-70 family)
MNWETFFLDNLPLIDRVTAFVSRKYNISGADAEDFASRVKLKLIEDDYKVLREFEKKTSLPTYLTIVIQRIYLDQKIHEWGKWRPSMRARQGGEAAIYLERLVSRDGLDMAEAATIVRQKYTNLDSRALKKLAASIVVRQPRRASKVEQKEEMREPASEASAEDELLSGAREAAARRASEVLSRELDRLPAEDRLIMKMRFVDAMKVSTMARQINVDQKQLYRRIDRLVAAMRESLLAAGVAMSDIGDMLFHGSNALQVDFARVAMSDIGRVAMSDIGDVHNHGGDAPQVDFGDSGAMLPPPPSRDGTPPSPGNDDAERRVLEVDAMRAVKMSDTVRVRVRLATDRPVKGLSERVDLLIPVQGLKVTIAIDASDFLRPLDDTFGTFTVVRRVDTQWLIFRFKPLREGRHPVTVRLFTGASLDASVSFEVTVEGERRAESSRDPIRKPLKLRRRGDDEVGLDISFDRGSLQYRYRWLDNFAQTTRERRSKALNDTPQRLTADIVKQLNQLARGQTEFAPAARRQFLRTRGMRLWDELIPDDLKQDYWERRSSANKVILFADADPMLWELLYPYGEKDDGFLVEQFLITRWSSDPLPTTSLRADRSVIVIPQNDTPEQAEAEAEIVRALLAKRGTVEVIRDIDLLLQRLLEPYDILHFACHSTFTSTGSQIRFGQGMLDADFFHGSHLAASPLVFINACRSDGMAETYTGLTGWAKEILAAGGNAFVGSLWEVRDEYAPLFAQQFYQSLLDGDTIASAAKSARESIREGRDATWLAYTLYADPGMVLK